MILWCPEGGMYAATGQARRPAPITVPVPPAAVDVPPVPVLAVAS